MLRKAAEQYKQLGISTIATDSNKRSTQRWKQYQQHIASNDEHDAMFNSSKCHGLAIVCGHVSGMLEVIDVDVKNDLTTNLFEDFIQKIIDADESLARSLVTARTKSGGYHLYYKCSKIEGNKKLALRYTTDAEKKENPHEKVRVLIETRGEGGYVVAAPSAGYTFINGSIANIRTITEQQRDTLLECARSFNSVIEEVTHNAHYIGQKSFSKSPFLDFNQRGDVVELLEHHGWQVVGKKGSKIYFLRPGITTAKSSGDYNTDLGFFSVFSTSTLFEPQKGYRPAAVYALLECNGDWKEAAKKLLAAGYGESYKRIDTEVKKYLTANEDEPEKLSAKIALKFGLDIEKAKAIINQHQHEEQQGESEFWYWDDDKEKIVISHTRFARFLECHGFGLYFYNKTSIIYKIVHNDNNRLEEVGSEKIKKFIQDYILNYELLGKEYTKEQLLETIYRNNIIFSEGLFEFLQSLELDFLRDTIDTCYIPFRNGIIEIKENELKLRNYGEINKVIWKEDVKDFRVDINLTDDFECVFSDFVAKICNNDNARILYMCSTIGYLLHKYKHPGRPFMPLFGEETEDETKGGGTGKGIFTKALTYMLPTEIIDGKTFKADKNFALQRVKLSTKLIIFQDLAKGFDVEKLYGMITDGITVEKKNKDELYIQYDDSPKMAATSNYSIDDSAQHARRRIKVIEFSSFFSPEHTPEKEYGHLFYNEWDEDEWNRFYNFMFYCVRLYLKAGLSELQQGSQYKRKKIRVQFGEEFLTWFADYAETGGDAWQFAGTLYSDFLNVNDMDKKDYSQKRFRKALSVAASNFGKVLDARKNSQHNGKFEYRLINIEKTT